MSAADGAREACACEMVGWARSAYEEDGPLLDEAGAKIAWQKFLSFCLLWSGQIHATEWILKYNLGVAQKIWKYRRRLARK
jgi:hypothetical protein